MIRDKFEPRSLESLFLLNACRLALDRRRPAAVIHWMDNRFFYFARLRFLPAIATCQTHKPHPGTAPGQSGFRIFQARLISQRNHKPIHWLQEPTDWLGGHVHLGEWRSVVIPTHHSLSQFSCNALQSGPRISSASLLRNSFESAADPAMSASIFGALNSHYRTMTASDEGFQAHFEQTPTVVSPARWQAFRDRYHAIRSFQTSTLTLFRNSLRGEDDPATGQLFLRDVPISMGQDFHLGLEEPFYTSPLFCRTDELGEGQIAEIQCPGSGWGEYCLLKWLYQQLLITPGAESLPDLAAGFNASLHALLNDPIIHHMTDNASVIASNVYFINSSRSAPNPCRYWGFDAHVRPHDCTFIRTHQYLELFADNLFTPRMASCRAGRLRYDHPLVCVFEQKLAMALPFMPRTRHCFSDSVRQLFPYTTLILPEGLLLEDGTRISIAGFCSLPAHERQYVIKYGGMDPSRNWGSQGVFFADEQSVSHLRQKMDTIVDEYTLGRGCWILQKSTLERGSTLAITDSSDVPVVVNGYRKFSAFYGPGGLLGVSTMVRPRKKVHGQPDAVFGIVTVETRT